MVLSSCVLKCVSRRAFFHPTSMARGSCGVSRGSNAVAHPQPSMRQHHRHQTQTNTHRTPKETDPSQHAAYRHSSLIHTQTPTRRTIATTQITHQRPSCGNPNETINASPALVQVQVQAQRPAHACKSSVTSSMRTSASPPKTLQQRTKTVSPLAISPRPISCLHCNSGPNASLS